MAGTLTISTLSDGTNSTSATNCIQGSAKAWVSIDSSGTIRSSYNVSSITVNAAGNYTANFTNALSDTNYSVVGMARKNNTSAGYMVLTGISTDTYTTSAFQFRTIYDGATLAAPSIANIAVFR